MFVTSHNKKRTTKSVKMSISRLQYYKNLQKSISEVFEELDFRPNNN